MEDSIVFGLTGPWGSGKSSMLAMIIEELESSHDEWRVVRFTPWASGDVNGLLGDFYASLASVLPKKWGKQIRDALGTMIQVSAPVLNAVPVAGEAGAVAARMAGDALKKATPWTVAFEEAADSLRKLDRPVLIVADDVDRLQTEELLALLKVVRLLGRFPGVHYLLAYDAATLFETLQGASLVKSREAASRFMEKIVQYPLSVPPLLRTQLLARLDGGIDSALAEPRRPPIESARLGELVDVFLSQLRTPRAIDRFLAQLRHHLPMVPESEINDVDVILLTLLRVAFPTLYAQLPRWREHLLSGNTGRLASGSSGDKYEAFDAEPLLGAVSPADAADARELLGALFPKISPDTYLYAAARGVRKRDYFDRYFAMGVPAHDVSDVEVRQALTRAMCGGETRDLLNLLSQEDGPRSSLVVTKASAMTDPRGDQGLTDSNRLALFAAVIPVLAVADDSERPFLSPRAHLRSWCVSLLEGLSAQAAPAEVIAALSHAPELDHEIEVVLYLPRRGEMPAWEKAARDDVSARALDAAVAHLAQGDSASTGPLFGRAAYFLRTMGWRDRLASAVAAGLGRGEFTIADVAARCIDVVQVMGVRDARPRLDRFDQEEFEDLVPPDADPWYESEQVDVDVYDLSWPNRRAFASGRARRPEVDVSGGATLHATGER